MSEEWKVISASVTGTSHHKVGLPCQDALSYQLPDPARLIVAVADGAGSAPRSQKGARIAAQEAAEYLGGFLREWVPGDRAAWEEQIRETYRRARDAVRAAADQESAPVRDYATTLTIAVADQNWLVTGQIGDCIVVAETEAGELITVAAPQKGEYANETNFLTMDAALQKLDARTLQLGEDIAQLHALAVFSDGLTRLALSLPDEQPHAPFFKPVLTFVAGVEDAEQASAQLAEFLDSERINLRTDDDKTLLLAVRNNAGGESRQPDSRQASADRQPDGETPAADDMSTAADGAKG